MPSHASVRTRAQTHGARRARYLRNGAAPAPSPRPGAAQAWKSNVTGGLAKLREALAPRAGHRELPGSGSGGGSGGDARESAGLAARRSSEAVESPPDPPVSRFAVSVAIPKPVTESEGELGARGDSRGRGTGRDRQRSAASSGSRRSQSRGGTARGTERGSSRERPGDGEPGTPCATVRLDIEREVDEAGAQGGPRRGMASRGGEAVEGSPATARADATARELLDWHGDEQVGTSSMM